MPDWVNEIRHRLSVLKLAPMREEEIVEELAQHLEDRYHELLSEGVTKDEAVRVVFAELIDNERFTREMRRVEPPNAKEPIIMESSDRNLLGGIWQDVRYGARSLLKTPGFCAVVVITLALGIGANTALFSVVNGVLLNPLPFPEPDQLVTLHQSKPNFDTGAIPFPNFRDLQKQNKTFTAMAISRPADFSLIGAGDTERVTGRWISADYFSVLRVQPALGRTFEPGEDEPGAGPVVLISNSLWQRKFEAAQDIVGKGLTLNDKSYTIVGVIPANFTLTGKTDVFVPIGQWRNSGLKNRAVALGLHGIGRMKPGVTVEEAEADLDRIMADLAVQYPDTNRNNESKVIALRTRLLGGIESSLWVLLGAVGFVLLIACVNVSNLLLARSSGRVREFAVRAALGAGQWRLLRQSFVESLILALVGGGLGLLVAGLGTKAALRALPTTLPRAEEVGLDLRVLIFTLAISLITGLLAGLVPAIKSAQWSLSETLKEGGRSVSSARGRAQGIFVAVEMALALILLIGAGLMIRSLSAIWKVDPGFRADNVLTFGLSLPPPVGEPNANTRRNSLRELSDKLAATPGVKAVSFSNGGIPMQTEDDLFFWLADQPKPGGQSEMNMALVYRVEPSYLTVMDIPLKKGRFFTAQDDERAAPVVVIDEVFAHKYFGNEDPLGKRIYEDGVDQPFEIVGVVGHVEQWGIGSNESLQAQLYEPFRQLRDDWVPNAAGVVIRTEGVPGESGASIFDSLRRVVQGQNSQNVIYRPQTMNEVIASTLAARRFSMILLNAFALVALLLASVGLYGVISYLVGQRTHELGIRITLGAQRGSVLRLVLAQGMKMALCGVALGLLSALLLTRLLTNMVYGLSTTDPLTFTVITLLLTMVALLACFVPAWRATRVDPLVALRYE